MKKKKKNGEKNEREESEKRTKKKCQFHFNIWNKNHGLWLISTSMLFVCFVNSPKISCSLCATICDEDCFSTRHPDPSTGLPDMQTQSVSIEHFRSAQIVECFAQMWRKFFFFFCGFAWNSCDPRSKIFTVDSNIANGKSVRTVWKARLMGRVAFPDDERTFLAMAKDFRSTQQNEQKKN